MHNVKSAICQYFPHSADYNSRLWEDDISMQRQVQGSDWGLGDLEIRLILQDGRYGDRPEWEW